MTALALHEPKADWPLVLEFEPVNGEWLEDRLANSTDLTTEVYSDLLDGVGRGLAAAHDHKLAFSLIYPRDVVLPAQINQLPLLACFDFFEQGTFPERSIRELVHKDANYAYLAPEHLGLGNRSVGPRRMFTASDSCLPHVETVPPYRWESTKPPRSRRTHRGRKSPCYRSF